MNTNEELVKLLIDKKMTITTAESCTGGMISALITDVPGASCVLKKAFVTYCDEAKADMLGVREDTLANYTAVSDACAREMAIGAAKAAGADAAISVTGIAGPDGGTENTPVGCVYIGLYVQGMVIVEKHLFDGDRRQVRMQAAHRAVHSMLQMIKE